MPNVEETFAIVRVLNDAGYMDLCVDCTRRRYDTAAWLQKRGYAWKDVQLMWLYAKHVSSENAEGMFAHWLKMPSRFQKKLEEAVKRPGFMEKASRAMMDPLAGSKPAPIISINRKAVGGDQ